MAIYNNQMYFGNRNVMQWIPAPKINYDSSRRSKFTTAQYTNGGAFVKRSATGARGYNFSWDMQTRYGIRSIMDYADGMYGLDEPLYFLDPFAMDTNLLPAYWAQPALGAKDAPSLVGGGDANRPTLVATPSNSVGLPSYAAQYILDSDSQFNSVYIPVPLNFDLWFGAYGSATGSAGLQLDLYNSPTQLAKSIALPLLASNSITRANVQVDGAQYTGAELRLKGSGTLTLYGTTALCLPDGQLPLTGNFISGQGHSGCSFNSDPVLTQYSAALDKVGLSIDLVETEGWK